MKLSTVMKALVAAAVIASPVAFAHGTHAVHQPKENIVAQKRTQVDGYYRMMIGDYEVTALYDGYLSIGAPVYQEFTKLTKQELDDLISGQFRPIIQVKT